MNNLFSSFDPQSIGFFKLNWLSAIFCLILIPPFFWLTPSFLKILLLSPLMYVWGELKAVTSKASIPGMLLPPLSLFIYIALNNSLGLLPHIFTASSHLVFTVSLALPLWIGHMLLSLVKTPSSMLAHLVPLGTPPILMPFMVLIEIVSSMIRPLTLSVRLAANMIAGHLLLTLLSNQISLISWPTMATVFIGLSALLVLEVAVALIQSYVFSVLSVLYLEEVNSHQIMK